MPGEDVELFIDQCRFAWSGTTVEGEERKLAIATTMMSGLRDTAVRFAREALPLLAVIMSISSIQLSQQLPNHWKTFGLSQDLIRDAKKRPSQYKSWES